MKKRTIYIYIKEGRFFLFKHALRTRAREIIIRLSIGRNCCTIRDESGSIRLGVDTTCPNLAITDHGSRVIVTAIIVPFTAEQIYHIHQRENPRLSNARLFRNPSFSLDSRTDLKEYSIRRDKAGSLNWFGDCFDNFLQSNSSQLDECSKFNPSALITRPCRIIYYGKNSSFSL